MTDTTEIPVRTPTPETRRADPLVLAAVAVLVVVAAVVVGRVVGSDDAATSQGSTAVPYDDPQAAGAITLCSADGTPVTGGSVEDTPFADLAVGETGLPADLDPTGAVVTLFGYQPRQGVEPAEFSGIALTATGDVADPEQPAVGVTDDVYSISDFVTAFPADDDGFVQLRLYLGTPDAGTLTESPYDTADLRVDGDRWELVHGGDASCADATS